MPSRVPEAGMDPQLIAKVDSFFDQPLHWDALWRRVTTDLGELPEDAMRAVSLALTYMLPHGDGVGREGYGPFVPMWEFDGEAAAPPLADVPEEMFALWADLAERCESPSARARFNDLLWSARRKPRPDINAREAAQAYIEVTGIEWPSASTEGAVEDIHLKWSGFRRAACLRRAHRIAREVGDSALIAKAEGFVVESATKAVANGASAGTILSLLRTLVQVTPEERRGEARAIVDAAKAQFDSSDHVFDELTELQVSLSISDGERRALRLEQVDTWVTRAHQSDGLGRLIELQKALEYARLHGLSERLDDLRAELDKTDPDTYQLGKISAPIDMDAGEVEKYLQGYVRDEGWESSLTAFGYTHGSPPSGELEKNLAFIEEMQAQTPLQFLFPTILMDDGGRPIAHAVSNEDKAHLALLRHEALGISLWGTWSVEILRRIQETFGTPTESDLVTFFTTEVIPEATAERIARAHILYFYGHYDECAHVLVPRIEAVIRQLCLRLGIPVARETFGKDAGGVAPLGALLLELAGRGLDESWLRYLVNALTEPAGMNLRNRICHGLIDVVGQAEAAILLHIIHYLRLLNVRPQEEAERRQSL